MILFQSKTGGFPRKAEGLGGAEVGKAEWASDRKWTQS